MEKEFNLSEKIIDYRKEICNIISEMLDNPDECEIYPTTRCYDKLEILFKQKDEDIKEFIKLYDNEDDELFIMVMGRLHAGVNDMALLRELIKEDFLNSAKKRDKLAGDELNGI